MPKRINRALEQRQSPTVEQLAELEAYINTIDVLATRINRSTLGGLLSSFLVIKFWPIHRLTFNFWLNLLNPILTCFSELFTYLVKKSDKDSKKNHSSIITSAELNTSSLYDLTLNIEDYFLMFSLFILINRYVVTPLFIKFFPQQFYWTTSPPVLLLREHQTLLTRNKVVESLRELKTVKQNLQAIRKTVYFLFYPSTLAFCLIRYFNEERTDATLHALNLLLNIYNNILDFQHQRQLEYKKETIKQKSKQLLNALSNDIELPDWNRIATKDNRTYYFHLSIFRENTRREHKPLEGIHTSRLVKELVCVFCNYEHIKVIAYNKYEITLFFRKLLLDRQVNEIITSFKSRLVNIKNKRKLIDQLTELFSSIHIKPEYEIQEINKNDLVTRYDFIISLNNIPNILKKELCKQLANCFSDNFLMQIKENNVIITQVTNIDQLRYEEALKSLKDWFATYQQCSTQSVNQINVSNFTKSEKSPNRAIFSRSSKKSQTSIDQKYALITPDQLHLSEHYKWRSGTYSSNGEGTAVKIRGGHNLFSVFKLKHEDFRYCQIRAYDHFKDITIINARIVPKKGCQGIVSTSTPVKDKHGIWFVSKYKAKALGSAYGNIRVYARQENDGQGHKLLIFDTVKLRSH